MPQTYEFDELGDYVFTDNGVPGDNTFSIFRDGAPYFDVVPPPDDLHFIDTIADVDIFLDLVDPILTTTFRIGAFGSSTSPDNIYVDALEAGVEVLLFAEGQIAEWGADAATDLTGEGMSLAAETGIGAGGAIEVETAVLEAQTTTGGISLRNSADIVVAGAGLSVQTSGGVALEAAGSVTLSASTGSSTLKTGDSDGDLTLKALGAGSDIACPTNQVAAVVRNGEAMLEAGHDILLGTAGTNYDNSIVTNGSIQLVAGRDVVLDGASDLKADAFFEFTGGSVTVTAGRHIRVGNATGAASGIIAFNGDVTLTTGTGGALSLLNPASDVITGNNVFIDADRVIMQNNAGISTGDIVIRTCTDGRTIDLGSSTDTARALELATPRSAACSPST